MICHHYERSILLLRSEGEVYSPFVIPGRAKREPGIHTPDRGYGFRACAKRRILRFAIAHRGMTTTEGVAHTSAFPRRDSPELCS
jgi:hypothetical protein